MANVSGAVQIETGIKHGLSIPFQSVAGEQSIDVGTLLMQLETHYPPLQARQPETKRARPDKECRVDQRKTGIY